MLESIIDSTFAEGTKNPIFFNFTLQQKQNYLVLLDSLGVEYIELICLQDIHDLIQFKNTSGLNIKFIICINNSDVDIEKVIQLQYIDVICIKIICIDNLTGDVIDNVRDNLKLLRSKLPKVQLQFCISDSFDIETNFLSSLYFNIDDYVDGAAYMAIAGELKNGS